MGSVPVLSNRVILTLHSSLLPLQEGILIIRSRSAWDVHGKPTDEVGANMAEFALGSIATMASNNPAIQTLGQLPTLGSRLKVTWAFATALLVSIAGMHSVLSAVTIYADWWNKAHLLGTFDGLQQG